MRVEEAEGVRERVGVGAPLGLGEALAVTVGGKVEMALAASVPDRVPVPCGGEGEAVPVNSPRLPLAAALPVAVPPPPPPPPRLPGEALGGVLADCLAEAEAAPLLETVGAAGLLQGRAE